MAGTDAIRAPGGDPPGRPPRKVPDDLSPDPVTDRESTSEDNKDSEDDIVFLSSRPTPVKRRAESPAKTETPVSLLSLRDNPYDLLTRAVSSRNRVRVLLAIIPRLTIPPRVRTCTAPRPSPPFRLPFSRI